MRLFSKHVDNRLSEYIDGRLTPAESAQIEAHVASCPDCEEGLAGLRRAIAALQSLPDVEAPRSFAINEAMVRPARAYQPPRWQPFAAPAAGMAVVFVLLLGGDLATSIDSEDDQDVVEDAASQELIEMDALASEQEATILDEDDSAPAADGDFTEEEDAGEADTAPADDSTIQRETTGEGGGDSQPEEPEEAAPAAPPDDETIERLENVDEDDDDFRLFVRLIEAGLAVGAVALGVIAFRRWRAAG